MCHFSPDLLLTRGPYLCEESPPNTLCQPSEQSHYGAAESSVRSAQDHDQSSPSGTTKRSLQRNFRENDPGQKDCHCLRDGGASLALRVALGPDPSVRRPR